MSTLRTAAAGATLGALLAASGAARGDVPPGPPPQPKPGNSQTTLRENPFSNPAAAPLAGGDGTLAPPALQGLDVHEHLDTTLPLDLSFRDSAGRPVKLRDAFHPGRPLVLTLVYFDCPMLCSLVLDGLVKGLTHLPGWVIGKDYDALTVSFNPADSSARAAEKRRGFLQALGASDLGDAWPFLTGEGPSVQALAQTVGFDYRYDRETGTFAHNAVVFVVTPEGKLARYLYGVTFDPFQLRLALTEAGQGKSGSSFERFLLSCYHYDPASRRYGLFIVNYFKAGGVVILLALVALLGWLVRRESQLHPPAAKPAH